MRFHFSVFLRRPPVRSGGLRYGCHSLNCIRGLLQYSGSIQLDLRRVPFSRFGSYMAFSHFSRERAGEDGLYFRSVHDSRTARSPARRPAQRGNPWSFTELATPTKLRLENEAAFVEICIAEPALIRIRLHGAGLRFSKIPGTGLYGLPRSTSQIELNSPGAGYRVHGFRSRPQDETHANLDRDLCHGSHAGFASR